MDGDGDGDGDGSGGLLTMKMFLRIVLFLSTVNTGIFPSSSSALDAIELKANFLGSYCSFGGKFSRKVFEFGERRRE